MNNHPLWHTGGQFNYRGLLASAATPAHTIGQQGYARPTIEQGDHDPAEPQEMTAEQRAAAAARGQQVRDFLKSGWGTLVKVAAPLAGFAIGGPPAAVAANTLVGLASAESPAEAGLAGLGGIAGMAGGNVARAVSAARTGYNAMQQWQQGHTASAVTTGLLGAANLAGQPLASNPYENLAAHSALRIGAGLIDRANAPDLFDSHTINGTLGHFGTASPDTDDSGGWGSDSRHDTTSREQHGPTRADGSFGTDGSGREYASRTQDSTQDQSSGS